MYKTVHTMYKRICFVQIEQKILRIVQSFLPYPSFFAKCEYLYILPLDFSSRWCIIFSVNRKVFRAKERKLLYG